MSKLIRIDDWVSGVRCIPTDISPMIEILEVFERNKIYYHLGVVPLTLSWPSFNFLQQSKYCVPVLHGFSHHYHEKSQICLKNNDPFNQFSVSGDFNEFEGDSDEEVYHKLFMGKRYLELIFKRPCWEYCPPNNIIDERTDKILTKVGFDTVLSENAPSWGSKLKYIKSDFYGHLHEIPDNLPKDAVVGLHITWAYSRVLSHGIEEARKIIEEKLKN